MPPGGILRRRNGRIAHHRHAVAIRKHACAAFRIRGDCAVADRNRPSGRQHSRAHAIKAGRIASRAVRRRAVDRRVGDGRRAIRNKQRVLIRTGRGKRRVRKIGILRNSRHGIIAFRLAALPARRDRPSFRLLPADCRLLSIRHFRRLFAVRHRGRFFASARFCGRSRILRKSHRGCHKHCAC